MGVRPGRAALTWVLIYRGITVSDGVSVLLGSLELLIMVALSITLLVQPAHPYSWTAPFDAADSPSKGLMGSLRGRVLPPGAERVRIGRALGP